MRITACLLLVLILAAFSAAQSTDTSFSVGPQYLITTNSTLFLQPIATPSLSLEPASPVPVTMQANPGTDVTLSAPTSAVQSQPDISRILWGNDWVDYVTGVKRASVIEIDGNANPKIPSSLFDTGVTGMTDAQALRGAGYGLTLGEVSTVQKSRPHASHVYTNADVQRLHGS